MENYGNFSVLKYTENDVHYHRSYEIICPLDNVILTINEKEYNLEKNCIAVIPPYAFHKISAVISENANAIGINFTERFIDKSKNLVGFDMLSIFDAENFIFSLGNEKGKVFYNTVKEINQIYTSNGRFSDAEAWLLICRLLIIINSHNSVVHNKSKNSKKFEEIVKYFEKNYSKEISLDLISEKFDINKFEISRLFNRYSGTTMVKYLNNLRIFKAKEYIQENRLSITEIGEKTGFGSLSAFGRVFKQITGVSPQKFKDNILKK